MICWCKKCDKYHDCDWPTSLRCSNLKNKSRESMFWFRMLSIPGSIHLSNYESCVSPLRWQSDYGQVEGAAINLVSFTFQEGAFSQPDVFSQIPFTNKLALEINFALSGVRNELVLRKINKMQFWQNLTGIILYLSPRQHPFLMVSFSSPHLSTIIEL